MNISILAKKLNMRSDELRKKIVEYGFRLRKNTKKISDRKVKEIIKKIERERKEKELVEKERLRAQKIPQKVILPSVLTVKEFSEIINKPVTEVITQLMKNGVMATINEDIDYETASIIASDFGIETEEKKEEREILKEKGIRKKILEDLATEEKSKLKPRPPVVTVMGHVDHGKTKLLDTLRKTNVIESEAGGITQHIGAYQVKEKGKVITFLDTPGHEAFREMRKRGAKVTDIVVLVVAADDGVKPQTKEAIKYAKEANVPIIVAINKIDKPEADPQRVRKELADIKLLPEEWGGDTICVDISAKYNKNLDKLLEAILLVAEMEELKANPEAKAIGTIIESHLDPKKGPEATVLVQNGTLKLGDPVTVGDVFGTIRAMENFQGKKIDHAKPSTPVKILGLNSTPEVGDILQVEESKEAAKNKILKLKKVTLRKKYDLIKSKEKGEGLKKLNIIIIADVQGSIEAILEALSQIESDEILLQIINYKVGKITESDVMQAASSQAIIFGFNTTITPIAEKLAKNKKVNFKIHNVIYKLVDDVKREMSKMLEPEIKLIKLGKLKVLAVFRTEKDRKIVGGKVTTGKLEKGSKVMIIRNGEKQGEGKIINLQSNKVDVDTVNQGKECGISIETNIKIKENDILESFKTEEIKKTIK